ncbi:hypothetical protein AgCh_029739 [Apium graveolens]
MASIQLHHEILMEELNWIKLSNGEFEDIVIEENGHFDDIVLEDTMGEEEVIEQVNQQTRPNKRGVPWTMEEHWAFMRGVEECGKGDWKNISQFFVSSGLQLRLQFIVDVEKGSDSDSDSYGSDIEKKSKAIDTKKAIEELQENDGMLINIKEQDGADDIVFQSLVLSQIPYNSLYINRLTDLKHTRSSSEGCHGNLDIVPLGVHIRCNSNNKETVVVLKKVENVKNADKENAEPNSGPVAVAKKVSTEKFHKKPRALKPTSLQLCMQMNEPEFILGSGSMEPADSEHSSR